MRLTRVRQDDGKGDPIRIKAVAVWDTVGSLGIPQVSWLNKIGITPSNKEYQFYDTNLSDKIEHAFHALALDETRPPFSPAVWERLPSNKSTTDLRQVWFPGNHGTANMSLAWMMDQLASVGVEFDDTAFTNLLDRTANFYATAGIKARWGVSPLYENNTPFRPWGLAAIEKASSWFYALAGQTPRTPGLYKQVDAKTSKAGAYLQDTNERIHPSVRVRLSCKGLGLNDKGVWDNPAMKGWKLVKRDASGPNRAGKKGLAPADGNATEVVTQNWGPPLDLQELVDEEGWGWEWDGGDKNAAPPATRLEEEGMGPYERFWLKKAGGGEPSVWQFAAQNGHE
jgi:type VI secretion system (T6SS) phospholipase Tle1-like effector